VFIGVSTSWSTKIHPLNPYVGMVQLPPKRSGTLA